MGSLYYLTCTRPDILYEVGLASRYMEKPKSTHLMAVKKIMCYIKRTISYGLLYTRCDDFQLISYTGSDWAGDVDERKSTTGYVFFLDNTIFSWSSKKQAIVIFSTCEAEYVDASSGVCHTIWLRNLLNDF